VVAVGVGVGLVVLAVAAVRLEVAPRTPVLPLEELAVVRGASRVKGPVALLYIDRACPRCRPAVVAFDSLVRASGTSGFVVVGDRRDSAGALVRYAADAGVVASGLALDTAHTLARAAALRAVPVLITVDRLGIGTVSYGTPVRLTHTGASP
jgi:hypothetical protein